MFDFNTGSLDQYEYNTNDNSGFDWSPSGNDSGGSFWDSVSGFFDSGFELAEEVFDYGVRWDNLSGNNAVENQIEGNSQQSVADQIANSNAQSRAGFSFASVPTTYYIAGALALGAVFFLARAK
jgi:hypothetical protein